MRGEEARNDSTRNVATEPSTDHLPTACEAYDSFLKSWPMVVSLSGRPNAAIDNHGGDEIFREE
jgi:hypothetical protein